MKHLHISDAFRGLMAALTAGLAFLMVHVFAVRMISGFPAASDNFIRAMFPVLTLMGMVAGMLFGLHRKRTLVPFWLGFWGLLVAGLLLHGLFLGPLNLLNLFAALISLLVFTGIWTYLMEVIRDNPLSFAHLMPEQQDTGETESSQPIVSGTVIKKRRD